MPTAARMAEYGVLKLILLKPAKTIDGAISLIAAMHSIISGRQKKRTNDLLLMKICRVEY